jgi:hypothetical protein
MGSGYVNRSGGFGRFGLVITESSMRSKRRKERSGQSDTEGSCTLKQNGGGYVNDFSAENAVVRLTGPVACPKGRSEPQRRAIRYAALCYAISSANLMIGTPTVRAFRNPFEALISAEMCRPTSALTTF